MPATIFLMCQGEQKRLRELGYPKQLVQINGEPLLHRTLRQLRSHLCTHDADIYVVARHGPEFNEACISYHAYQIEIPYPGICIVDGIRNLLEPDRITSMRRNAASYHSSRVIDRWYVMLGDVAWSDDAIHRFLVDTRDHVFAGTSNVSSSLGEVFGTSFVSPEEVRMLTDTCPCRVRPDGSKLSLGDKQRGGHLRRLLWHAMTQRDLKPDNSRVANFLLPTWSSELYLPIDDGTDDIDTPADVRNIPALSKRLVALDGTRMNRDPIAVEDPLVAPTPPSDHR